MIRGYGDQIISIQQPDLSEPVVPKKEKKFRGYFKIARLEQRRKYLGGRQIIMPRRSFLAENLDNLADNYDHLGSKMSARKLLRGVMI